MFVTPSPFRLGLPALGCGTYWVSLYKRSDDGAQPGRALNAAHEPSHGLFQRHSGMEVLSAATPAPLVTPAARRKRLRGTCITDTCLMTPAQIGATARRTRSISARDIELFTEITGDRNPIHYDEALATRSRFGGIVVQGGVTSGLLNALVAEQLPGPGSVFLEVSWKFLAPVRPGDVITAEAVVTAAREDKPVTTLATTVTNQDGDIVLDGTAVVWRDPSIEAAYETQGG
jgi:acyl dehydratase